MADTSLATCPICCSDYNKRTRARVECRCGGACCAGCLQQYVLGLAGEARCIFPACGVRLDREFLDANLPASWVNGPYKEHLERVLLEREMALLPATQAVLPNWQRYCRAVDAWKAARAAHAESTAARHTARARLATARARLVDLTDAARKQRARKTAGATAEARREAREELARLTREAREARETRAREAAVLEAANAEHRITAHELGAAATDRHYAMLDRFGAGVGARRAEPQARRQFVRGCPADGCRGFLASDWTCGTCATKACKHCGDALAAPGEAGEAHVCDEAAKASHALIQKDSRPCPKCASMIHKISG